jgi:hypothetical protein
VSDFLIVLAFAALPAADNFAGGLAAEIFNVSDRATPSPAGGRSREEPADSPTVRPRPAGPTS